MFFFNIHGIIFENIELLDNELEMSGHTEAVQREKWICGKRMRTGACHTAVPRVVRGGIAARRLPV